VTMAVQSALSADGWQPDEGNLQSVVGLMMTSLDPHVSNDKRTEVAKQVDALKKNPEFTRYLAFIFAEAGSMVRGWGCALRDKGIVKHTTCGPVVCRPACSFVHRSLFVLPNRC